MARTKKSRKPASAPTAKPKLSKKELANVEKRIRKSNGKQAGNRQQEAKPIKEQQQTKQNRDPRLGSKKPIILIKETVKSAPIKSTHKTKQASIAAVTVVEKNIIAAIDLEALEKEIETIEQDQQLQSILAKQEQKSELSEQEVNYYNKQMTRHQEICELLGYSDEDDFEDESTEKKLVSEDDLWNKLDNSDLSDY
ncbi:MAG: GTPase-activating protein [Alteromonadaceae bacterium]|nr:GTPase-activating protein [Alteromonadaceae bacterium]